MRRVINLKRCLAVWSGLLLGLPLPVEAHNGAVAIAVPVEGIKIDGDLSDWPEGMGGVGNQNRSGESDATAGPTPVVVVGRAQHLWLGAAMGAGAGFVVTQKFGAMLDPSGFCDFRPFDFPSDCFCSVASTASFGLIVIYYVFTDPGRVAGEMRDRFLTTQGSVILGTAVLGAIIGASAGQVDAQRRGLVSKHLPELIGCSRFGTRMLVARWRL